MTTRSLGTGFTLAVALLVGTATMAVRARQATSPEALLGAGLHQEEVEGNLEAAIDTYQKVAANPKATHAVAARALLQLGVCYEKLGRRDDARTSYERIVSQYSDVAVVVTAARTKLAAVQTGQGASTALPFRERSLDQYLKDVTNPQVSPDGKSVMYFRKAPGTASPANTRWELDIRELATGKERKVLDNLPETSAGWSPDSQRIAITSGFGFEDLTMADLMALGPDSSMPISKGTALAIVPAISGKGRALNVSAFDSPSLNEATWSPDGTLFPYLARTADGKAGEPRLLNVITGESRPLGGTTSGDPAFHWSLDGRRLCFRLSNPATKAEDIHFLTLATGEHRTVSMPSEIGPHASLGKLTLKGQVVNTSPPAPNAGMFLVSDDGRSVKKVCAREANGDECFDMAFDASSVIVWKAATKKLWRRDVATGSDTPLTLGAGEELHSYRSRDGRLETFTSNRDGRWAQYVVLLDHVPVQNPIRVASLDSPAKFVVPSWTGAGTLFTTTYSDSNIVRVDVDARTGKSTTLKQRLTLDAPWNDWPALSPDGKRIAYWYRKGTTSGIGVVDATGTNERLVVERTPANSQIRWRSPEELLFEDDQKTSDQLPRIVALNISTGSIRPVFQPVAPTVGWQYAPGRDEILYISDYRQGEARSLSTLGYLALKPSAPRTLWAHPLSGGPDREVVRIGPEVSAAATFLDTPFVATPDGRAVAFLRYNAPPDVEKKTIAELLSLRIPADIVLLPLDGGPEKVLFTYPNALNASHIGPVAWSPDAKFLLFGGAGGRPRVFGLEAAKDWALIDPPNASAWNGEGHWAPDGSFIVFAVAESRIERKMYEGLTTEGVVKAMAGRGR